MNIKSAGAISTSEILWVKNQNSVRVSSLAKFGPSCFTNIETFKKDFLGSLQELLRQASSPSLDDKKPITNAIDFLAKLEFFTDPTVFQKVLTLLEDDFMSSNGPGANLRHYKLRHGSELHTKLLKKVNQLLWQNRQEQNKFSIS